jgi:acid stress chaperone HdeB
VALALALLPSGFAVGQVTLDIAKITCWQFATYKVTDPQFIAIWISGYHHGKRNDTVIDIDDLLAKTAKMQDYCTKNPDVPLTQAVEIILGDN